jgi:hypothetical protein
MASDPHPEHDQCPEINQVGRCRPGSAETGNLVTVSPAVHDHDDPDNASLKGRIVIR